jgi:hypothetical protein
VGDAPAGDGWDFFVSYTQSDRAWAEWIAWELEDAGYRVIVQAWDMPVGSNWAEAMHRATSAADRTVAVVSPAYLDSEYGTAEWLAAFAQDPLGRAGKLVPVKVDPFPWPAGLLGPIVGIDLSGLAATDAAARLRTLVGSRPGQRSKPADRPGFPGPKRAATVTGPAQGRLAGLVIGALPRRPPAFQERDAVREVAEIAGSGGLAVVCAVAGGRGVGKTQTAAAYARMRLEEGFPLVVWTSGETPQSLLADYAAAAEQLGVADRDGDSAKSALRLTAYLQELAVPSVLVIDNTVRQPGEAGLAWLEPCLPAVGRCEVVITSTDHGFGELGELVEVGVFERAQSVAYLTARTGRNDPDGADRVADALGDLPAALAHVPGVLRARRWSCARYLEELAAVPLAELMPAGSIAGYPKGAAAALLLAVQSAEAADPDGTSGGILRLMAVLDPDGVRPDHLLHLATNGAEEPAAVRRVEAAVGRLVDTSLLSWTQTGDTVVLHRLTGQVMRDQIARAGAFDRLLADTAVHLARMFPSVERAAADRLPGTGLALHALTLVRHARSSSPEAAEASFTAGLGAFVQLTYAGDISLAVGAAEALLAFADNVFGGDHPHTLGSRSNLANAYWSAGRTGEAVRLHERTLADRERLLGPDHPDTLASRNNLAIAYQAAGRTDDAERLRKQASDDAY